MVNLRKLRKEKGLTQQILAEKFGLSQQSIYKYETGLAEPDITTLMEFADFFDTSIDYLVGFTDIPTPYNKIKIENFSTREIEILNFYRNLDAETQSSIYKILKKLAEACKMSL